MGKTSRRNILKTGAALGAGMVSGTVLHNGNTEAVCAHESCSNRPGHTNRWDHEYTWGHDKLFMEEYYDGTMEILGSLSGEIDQIGSPFTTGALFFDLPVRLQPRLRQMSLGRILQTVLWHMVHDGPNRRACQSV